MIWNLAAVDNMVVNLGLLENLPLDNFLYASTHGLLSVNNRVL